MKKLYRLYDSYKIVFKNRESKYTLVTCLPNVNDNVTDKRMSSKNTNFSIMTFYM